MLTFKSLLLNNVKLTPYFSSLIVNSLMFNSYCAKTDNSVLIYLKTTKYK